MPYSLRIAQCLSEIFLTDSHDWLYIFVHIPSTEPFTASVRCGWHWRRKWANRSWKWTEHFSTTVSLTKLINYKLETETHNVIIKRWTSSFAFPEKRQRVLCIPLYQLATVRWSCSAAENLPLKAGSVSQEAFLTCLQFCSPCFYQLFCSICIFGELSSCISDVFWMSQLHRNIIDDFSVHRLRYFTGAVAWQHGVEAFVDDLPFNQPPVERFWRGVNAWNKPRNKSLVYRQRKNLNKFCALPTKHRPSLFWQSSS